MIVTEEHSDNIKVWHNIKKGVDKGNNPILNRLLSLRLAQ